MSYSRSCAMMNCPARRESDILALSLTREFLVTNARNPIEDSPTTPAECSLNNLAVATALLRV